MDFPYYVGLLDFIDKSVIPEKHFFEFMGDVLDLCEMLAVSAK